MDGWSAVYGVHSGTGFGVSGSGNPGVYGTSTTGHGVRGETSNNASSAVYGSHSGSGYGVRGIGNPGVYGTSSVGGTGVSGIGNPGVYGGSTTGHGIKGESSMDGWSAVYGVHSGNGFGISGSGNPGIFGTSTTGTGIRGESSSYDEGAGVWGYNYGPWPGVAGVSEYGYGVFASTHSNSITSTGLKAYGSSSNGIQAQGLRYGVEAYGNTADFYASHAGYAPFTGVHEVELSKDFPIYYKSGMIVSVSGKTKIRRDKDGIISLCSILPTVNLSNKPLDRAVFGVLVKEISIYKDHWYQASEGDRFASVNALGEGRVLVTNVNGNVEMGDFITTSAIPGYGQKQPDDLLHSYTLGKVVEEVDWDTVTETIEHDGHNYKVYLIAVVYTSG
jgi:hypothetical protein